MKDETTIERRPDVAIQFVDRMEQHIEELRWDDRTYRLFFDLIRELRERGFDAAPWWKHGG